MGIRQTLNENPVITTIVAGAITVVALGIAIKMSCGGGGGASRAGGPGKQFFSIDDGKTWFADDSKKIPPFQHEGKPAYRVRVFKCGETGLEFVSHMERYNDADKKKLEDALAKAEAEGKSSVMAIEYGAFQMGLEVKKPGDKEWVKMGSKDPTKYTRVMQPKCPDGSTAAIQLVMPK